MSDSENVTDRPDTVKPRSRIGLFLIIVGIVLLTGVLAFVLLRSSQQPEATPATGVTDSSGFIPASSPNSTDTAAAPTSGAETIAGTVVPAVTRPASVPTPLPDVEEMLTTIPTSTPPSGPARPARLEVQRVGIDVSVATVVVGQDGYLPTPDREAGYWALSSPLDGDGNVVIVGHNRPEPQPVFLNLPLVEIGDEIIITDQFGREYTYLVTETTILQVEGNAEEAQRTLDYIDLSLSQRLTLVTCYPEGACTHRLIVVATPADG